MWLTLILLDSSLLTRDPLYSLSCLHAEYMCPKSGQDSCTLATEMSDSIKICPSAYAQAVARLARLFCPAESLHGSQNLDDPEALKPKRSRWDCDIRAFCGEIALKP